MIRLILLLLGAGIVKRRWRFLLTLGILWAGCGVFLAFDALDEHYVIPVRYLGYVMIIEGLATASSASAATGTAQRLRWFKALSLFMIGGLAALNHHHANLVLAILLGLFIAVDGIMKVSSAQIVRFPGWRTARAIGIGEIFFAIFVLEPYPTWYKATVGVNMGALMLLSGLGLVRLGLRLKQLPDDAPLSPILQQGLSGWTFIPAPANQTEQNTQPAQIGELIVHVWTPTGLSPSQIRSGRLIGRYIAAVDQNGVVSTGHAALEMAPDVYISHYPKNEIDRNPGEFGRILRATHDNDVEGRFLPTYQEEAAGWCEATAHVRFEQFDPARLRAFWNTYRQDNTYNLTNRNCSSVVAQALDAALEGALTSRTARLPLSRLMRIFLSPELWVAGLLRQRAESMAWTPGLVLDYARALSAVIEPPPISWLSLAARAWRRQKRTQES
ncbi:HdeD family acid-resistance protein [Granulibacter bethesdensis]|uniref:HdeD family acid-resistance protein n=1 Tax=Granulibacter bethesdensis TaxID=364410 RepID=UPI00090A726E|nr:protease [Granulibacter bethesdensis]APH59664.1 putative membrane-bound protease [Granulibacter bethesdensis]